MDLVWHRVADSDGLDEGGVQTITVEGKTLALVRFEGEYRALDNTCPHMGGPLGQGTIEYGLLVCPWHGREYDPRTGQCEGYEEHVNTYPVEAREDGVYVGLDA